MGTTQGCCVLFGRNPGNSSLQNSICMAIYLPSRKPSQMDDEVILGPAGEVKTNA